MPNGRTPTTGPASTNNPDTRTATSAQTRGSITHEGRRPSGPNPPSRRRLQDHLLHQIAYHHHHHRTMTDDFLRPTIIRVGMARGNTPRHPILPTNPTIDTISALLLHRLHHPATRTTVRLRGSSPSTLVLLRYRCTRADKEVSILTIPTAGRRRCRTTRRIRPRTGPIAFIPIRRHRNTTKGQGPELRLPIGP